MEDKIYEKNEYGKDAFYFENMYCGNIQYLGNGNGYEKNSNYQDDFAEIYNENFHEVC